MIDEHQLMENLGKFRDMRQLERDYLLTLLLHEISSKFANELIFKGGTALKYFYNLNRFSEDLDFSYMPDRNPTDVKALAKTIESVILNLGRQYQVVSSEHRTRKEGNKTIGLNYMIRVRGPLNPRSSQLQNINIDLSLRNDILLKSELKYISPIYQDIGTFSLQVMNIEEILAEKVSAVLERSKMRDIYDVYYLLVIKKINYDEKLIKEKVGKRNEKFDKKTLKKKIETARDKMKWRSELAYTVNPLPENGEVIKQLTELMNL